MRTVSILMLFFIILTFLPVYSQNKPEEPSEAEKHAIEGLNLLNGGDFQGAKTALKKALELEPDNKDYLEALIIAYKRAGLQYVQEGNKEGAIKEYLEALSKKPKDVELNYNLAYLYHCDDKPDKAKPYYSKCLELEPKGSFAESAYLYLGNIYFAEKNYEKASVNYQGALDLKGTNQVMAYYNLGLCHLKTDKLDKAEQEFLAAIKLSPAQAQFYGSLGELYIKKKDYAKALENYNKATGYDSGNYIYQKGLAITLQETGNLDGAIQAYNTAISLNSTDAETHYFLGSLYVQKENYELASEELKKAIDLDSDNKVYLDSLTAIKSKLSEMEAKKNSIRFVDSDIESVFIDGTKIENNIYTIYVGNEYDIEIIYTDGTTLSGILKMLDNDISLDKGYKFGKISETDKENARMGGTGTIYLKGSDGSKDIEINWEGSMN